LRSGALQSRGPTSAVFGTVPVLRSSASQELRAASRPGHGIYGTSFFGITGAGNGAKLML
jgi:hypothetical protein